MTPTARTIAATLGDPRREGRGFRCRCPLHGGRSLMIQDGHNGQLLVTCWGGCDRLDVLAELCRRGLTERQSKRGTGAVLSVARFEDGRRIAAARRLWDAAEDARGSPVERYFASRGINVPPPPSLRYAPACRHPRGIYLPAMVAAILDPERAVIGVHRTFLQPDGSGKAKLEPQKAMLGRAKGGAVRLSSVKATLAITEGIETGLAILQATNTPTWAALCASGIEALSLPLDIEFVIVCADHDWNGRGKRAAEIAAQRWLEEGRRVKIALPPEVGTDFNDVLLADISVSASETGNAA